MRSESLFYFKNKAAFNTSNSSMPLGPVLWTLRSTYAKMLPCLRLRPAPPALVRISARCGLGHQRPLRACSYVRCSSCVCGSHGGCRRMFVVDMVVVDMVVVELVMCVDP